MSKIICQFDMLEDRRELEEKIAKMFLRAGTMHVTTTEVVGEVVRFIESRDLKAKFTIFDQTKKMQALPPFAGELYEDFDRARRHADEYHKRQTDVSTKTQQTEVRAVVVVHKRKE